MNGLIKAQGCKLSQSDNAIPVPYKEHGSHAAHSICIFICCHFQGGVGRVSKQLSYCCGELSYDPLEFAQLSYWANLVELPGAIWLKGLT